MLLLLVVVLVLVLVLMVVVAALALALVLAQTGAAAAVDLAEWLLTTYPAAVDPAAPSEVKPWSGGGSSCGRLP